MADLAYFRKFLILIFSIAFFYMFYKAVKALKNPQEGISFESVNDGKFPSVTICPLSYLNGEQMWSFDGFWTLPSILDYANISMLTFESYEK